MKAFYVLLLLIPILAVAVMMAGMLGFDTVGEVCLVAFFVSLATAFIWAHFLLTWEIKRRFLTPLGWDEARTLCAEPKTIDAEEVRGFQFVRERGRGRAFPCRLRFHEEGVLIEDDLPIYSFADVFVAWDMLELPRQIAFPWPWHYTVYAFFWKEPAVEVYIRETQLSLVVTIQVWNEYFAPNLPGVTSGSPFLPG